MMSYRKAHNLKNVLCLFTATYAAYSAYLLLCEEEKRSLTRKKRRRRAQLRSVFKEDDSTSSDEECETPSSTHIHDTTKRTDEEQKIPIPKSSNSIDRIKICNPRTIKIERSPSVTNGDFVKSIVSTFSDDEFKKHFRVSRKTMENLNEMFKSSTEYKNILKLAYNMKIPANYYVMMFLWFAGKGCSFLELSKVFNVPMSRSVGIIDTVLQFLDNCAKNYICFPDTPSQKRVCADGFQEFGAFPDVIGCLVNSYIQSASQESISTIQAICDSHGRFLDVYVDATHKVHHTQMLQTSPINNRLRELCQGRYHILANGDYNVREWLLTPYKEPISVAQKLYNTKHRKTLEAVSNCLDALRLRFKQLTSMPSFSTSKMKKMIIPCCVLQNICLSEGDYFLTGDADPQAISSIIVDEIETDVVIADDPHLRKIGELKRRQIMEALK